MTLKLIGCKDPAVLDRIDIKQHMPEPGVRARYEILRKCYLDLLESNVIAPLGENVEIHEDEHSCSSDFATFETEELATPPCEALPTYETMQISFRIQENSVPYRLWKIVEKSAVGHYIFQG